MDARSAESTSSCVIVRLLEEVGERVRGILRDVAGRGDAAVVAYTNRFDRRDAASGRAAHTVHVRAAAAREPRLQLRARGHRRRARRGRRAAEPGRHALSARGAARRDCAR